MYRFTDATSNAGAGTPVCAEATAAIRRIATDRTMGLVLRRITLLRLCYTSIGFSRFHEVCQAEDTSTSTGVFVSRNCRQKCCWTAALEKQLGLKLVKVKGIPVDVLVIDHVDKVPTDN